MAKPPKASSNPIVIKPGINIGASAAEDDDELLFSCFEDNGVYSDLENLNSPRYLLKGRTGSGKTAFLRRLEQRQAGKVIRIDPHFLCLKYISNSDVMRYLASCDVDIEPFFQIIWRHAFCTELLKRRYNIDNADRNQSYLQQLALSLQPNKRRAIEYIQSLGGDLWPDLETRVTEIARKVEAKLGAGLAADTTALKAKINGSASIAEEEKSEVRSRVNRILYPEQLGDLSPVISFLADEVFGDDQHQFYIIIDDLDQFVVDDTIRYLLLRALIDAIKKFKAIRRVKFCVAIRSDLLELIFERTRRPGFQAEKYEDSILEIRWTKDQLLRLVDKRITETFKRRYTQRSVSFDDIFPKEVGRRSTREYMFERTLRRPRDLIAFVNQCFLTSSDKSVVSTKSLREAEAPYSEKRRSALIEEWIDAHPLADVYFILLQRQKALSRLQEYLPRVVPDLIDPLVTNASAAADPLGRCALGYLEDRFTELDVLQQWIATMYKLGVIGVKVTPQSPIRWAMSDAPAIAPSTLGDQIAIEVHPMMYRAAGVFPRHG